MSELIDKINEAVGLGSSHPRWPGETNLENALIRFAWLVEKEYLGSPGANWTVENSQFFGQVDSQALVNLKNQVDSLYNLITLVPAWSTFTPAQRASISAQTGIWLQNLIPGPDYTQNTVLLVDPASEEFGGCFDPALEDGPTVGPCEVAFRSDCFTLSMPSNRDFQTSNWSRTFGCNDYFYSVEQAVDLITQTVSLIDGEVGLNQDGGVGVAEIGGAVLDEVITTRDAVTDADAEIIVPWFVFAAAGVLGFLALRGLRA